MEPWQIRQEAMLPGSSQLLAEKRVIIFGIGGVGAQLCEALARAGVGSFTLVDSDTVNESNINRQIIALHSTVGAFKTEVMMARIKDINPKAEVTAVNEFVDGSRALELCKADNYDFIADAVDTVSVKLALAEYSEKASVPLISSMGTGNKLHPELFTIADIYSTSVCPLCRVMRSELRKRGVKGLTVVYSTEEPVKAVAESSHGRHAPASVSFTPTAAGLIMAGHIVRTLLKRTDV